MSIAHSRNFLCKVHIPFSSLVANRTTPAQFEIFRDCWNIVERIHIWWCELLRHKASSTRIWKFPICLWENLKILNSYFRLISKWPLTRICTQGCIFLLRLLASHLSDSMFPAQLSRTRNPHKRLCGTFDRCKQNCTRSSSGFSSDIVFVYWCCRYYWTMCKRYSRGS